MFGKNLKSFRSFNFEIQQNYKIILVENWQCIFILVSRLSYSVLGHLYLCPPTYRKYQLGPTSLDYFDIYYFELLVLQKHFKSCAAFLFLLLQDIYRVLNTMKLIHS